MCADAAGCRRRYRREMFQISAVAALVTQSRYRAISRVAQIASEVLAAADYLAMAMRMLSMILRVHFSAFRHAAMLSMTGIYSICCHGRPSRRDITGEFPPGSSDDAFFAKPLPTCCIRSACSSHDDYFRLCFRGAHIDDTMIDARVSSERELIFMLAA